MASHTDPNATAPTPPLPQLRHLGVSRLQGTDVVIFAIAAGCMWIQWTSGRGQSLAGKEYEMDATMLDPKERARAEAEGVPVAVIQDKAGQVAM